MFTRLNDLDKATSHAECLAPLQSYMWHMHLQADTMQGSPRKVQFLVMQTVSLLWQERAWKCGLAAHLEVIDAVGGSRGEGNLLSSSAGQDDLQPLHHAASGRHGVILIIASQKDGATPVPVCNMQV